MNLRENENNKNSSNPNLRLPPIGSSNNNLNYGSNSQNGAIIMKSNTNNFNNGNNLNYEFTESYNYNNVKEPNIKQLVSNNNNNNNNNSRQNLNSRDAHQNMNNNNFIQNQSYSSTNLNSNSNLEFINIELNNTKRILKNVMDNQTELQTKIIDYNKIINEQENIIRLNNMKLNEHDCKLTEILITFNNYLQINDKTNKIVNDLTLKCEDSIKKSELVELKANLYNFNRNNETKILNNFNKIEELDMKAVEISKEQEVFQKYTLEKLRTYQNEAIENRIQQQQQLIKHEESKENKINQQFEQVKGLIKILEKNQANDAVYKKNLIENVHEQILQEIVKRDERILNLEKNQLEAEKKFINFNKDYITTFQELISKHHQKYEIEFKSIKSILENGFFKLDLKFEEKFKKSELDIFNLKTNLNENKNNLTEIENYFRENLDELVNKYGKFEKDFNYFTNKVEIISDTLSGFMNENLTLINDTIDNKFESSENKIFKNINEIITNIQIFESKNNKNIFDLNEKIENCNKTIAEVILLKQSNIVENNSPQITGSNTTQIDIIILERKIEDKIQKVVEDIESFEKKLIMMMNLHIDTMKRNINEEQRILVNNISEKLELKISCLQKDIEEKKKEDEVLKEGRMQVYIIESEERLKKVLIGRINKIQEDKDGINNKLNLNYDVNEIPENLNNY